MSTLKNILASVALASSALAAQAQVTTNVNYNLALSDQAFTGRFYSGQPCNIETASPNNNRYRTLTMQVTMGGSYAFNDEGYDIGAPYNDGTLGVYSGAFNPASPSTNCVGSVDDDQELNLTPGTYTLVLTSYEGQGGGEGGEGGTGIPGQFFYEINGPARVVLAGNTPAAVTAVPTLSEWTLMLLALCAAGLGASRLRRKS